MPSAAPPRAMIGVLALGYLLFVIYGSVVPLNFTQVPWEQAAQRFQHIPYLQLGIGSRADWVANILLFIPLTFFILGWVWPRRRGAMRAFAALFVIALALALSVGIEFVQIYFPHRTVSLNDILAEAAGGVLGVGLWLVYGERLVSWLGRWHGTLDAKGITDYLLWAYLAGIFLYGVLPLDLTVSPVEIYHKWQEGKLILIPFSYPYEGLASMLYGLAVDILLWVPVSALWVLSGRRTSAQAFVWGFVAAALLELAQLLVYSRVSDVTDLFTAALGAGIGAVLGARLMARQGGPEGAEKGMQHAWLWLVSGLVVWCLVLAAIYWYPFDFVMDRALLRSRAELLLQVPFRNYYFGSEFRAVTELLHKLLWFAPLGVLPALGWLRLRRFSPWRPVLTVGMICLAFIAAGIIELGQVGLLEKYPDSTDLVLEVSGAILAYLLVILVGRRMNLARRRPAVNRDQASRSRTGSTRLRELGGYDWVAGGHQDIAHARPKGRRGPAGARSRG